MTEWIRLNPRGHGHAGWRRFSGYAFAAGDSFSPVLLRNRSADPQTGQPTRRLRTDQPWSIEWRLRAGDADRARATLKLGGYYGIDEQRLRTLAPERYAETIGNRPRFFCKT